MSRKRDFEEGDGDVDEYEGFDEGEDYGEDVSDDEDKDESQQVNQGDNIDNPMLSSNLKADKEIGNLTVILMFHQVAC